jgi:hypothetical protein
MNSPEIKKAIIELNEKIGSMSDEEILDMIEKMDTTDPLYEILSLMFLFSEGP